MNVASLEAARNKAREAAASHPNQAQVETLTRRIVDLKNVLKRQDRTPAQKAEASKELAELEKARASLQATQHASLQAAQAALTEGRRSARSAERTAAAAKLRSLSTDELVQRRHELTEQRKALKLELEPVVSLLGERQAEERLSELLSTMNDADKRALLQRLQVDGVASAEKVGTPGGS